MAQNLAPLKYGNKIENINLEQLPKPSILTGIEIQPLKNPVAALKKALRHPIDSPSFKKIMTNAGNVVIVIPDHTRRAGAKTILPIILESLEACGVPREKVTILIGRGVHRALKKAEIKEVIGPELLGQIKVVEHDCKREEKLVELGVTSAGTKVKLNRLIVEADRIIVTGLISYHYFAGFSGGLKSIAIGCASLETILGNHSLTVDSNRSPYFNPGAAPGVLDENPVWKDLQEIAGFLKPHFLVNTAMTNENEIGAIFAGNPHSAFRKGCEFVDYHCGAPLNHRANLVISCAGGYPYDINFIQSHKSYENAFRAVLPGETLVLLAECKSGIGNPRFLTWFDRAGPDQVARSLRSRFRLNGQTALATMVKAMQVRTILVSELDEAIVERMGMIPARTLEEGLTHIERGISMTSIVMPDSHNTLPLLGHRPRTIKTLLSQ